MSDKILLVEDDSSISGLIKLHLEEFGYSLTVIPDGNEAINEFPKNTYALIIIDLMLPGLDGREVIKRIRATNSEVPILITTAKGDLMHKVVGFEIGADDYLAKPFEIEELVARAKALIRRSSNAQKQPQEDQNLEIGNIKVDRYRHKVYLKDKEIQLTPKLYDLLVFLMTRPGRAYSRNELLLHVWNYENEGYEHTVDTHINRLRSRIEPQPATPTYILTVWGVGYRFAEPAEIKAKIKS